MSKPWNFQVNPLAWDQNSANMVATYWLTWNLRSNLRGYADDDCIWTYHSITNVSTNEPNYIGLPPSWATALSTAGFDEEEIAAIHARRKATAAAVNLKNGAALMLRVLIRSILQLVPHRRYCAIQYLAVQVLLGSV
ncbi:hypothetical protein BKA82DRAFT_503981 [Pisolithus tinctorius]|uniref:Uncharacterized protein n=1 Tax=Pisolithus tinctorius Marx 270 TaxID=870435 RepID=A0A0C3K8A0_PISTI|nr:hypothetical protein BKA82DRAFT_503981 [Pisolithus tinctorius]KIO05787.1 hypothetical protein M404DRAFT_503981 [Pisolithus tinctorius Marx 270]